MAITEAQVREALAKVNDPAFDKDIVNYRILNKVEVSGDDVLVKLDIPSHAYPLALRKELIARVDTALKGLGAKRATIIPEVNTAFLPAPSELINARSSG